MPTQNNTKQFDYLVYIGRFQIFHNGHLSTIRQALKLANKVVVVIGSSNLPRTVKNPFTAAERKELITISLPDADQKRVLFTHANDYMYNDQKWVTEIQTRVSAMIMEKGAKVGIIGLKKDESSFYLELFPQWEFVGVEEIRLLHSTDLRAAYFEGSVGLYPHEKHVPPPVVNWLFSRFLHTDHYEKLVEEYNFLKKYKEQWEVAPYPVIFVTVDAVVIQSGHVLMVKRKANPGQGLYALPGGFINPKETVAKAAIRELKEETRIKLPDPVLEGHMKESHVFDAPSRSERGRTITHAFLIELPGGPLAKVKGGDDAASALWMPLEDFEKKRDQMYEDHADIITYFLGRL